MVISKWGYEYALGGFVVVGFLGCILAVLIYKFGSDWIDVVLALPAAMGPVVALIGLELAGTAASNAGLTDEVIDVRNVIVFLVTLLVAVLGSVLFRGFLSVIPILIAIIAGYIAALACGIVDFSQVAAAPLFSLPNFSAPKFTVGGDRDHHTGTACHHLGAHRASDRDQQDRGKRSFKRSGTPPLSFCR